MIRDIIMGMVGAIIGTVAFIAVRALISGMDTSGWSAGEVTIIVTILPLAVAIMALVVVFAGVMKVIP